MTDSQLPVETLVNEPPIETLVRDIKARIDAGDQGHRQADQTHREADEHYMAAGRLLVELKQLTETKEQFEIVVRLKLQIGVRRAYDLIAVAEGRDSFEEQRERNRTANKAHRERKKSSASRDAQREPQQDQGDGDPLQRAQDAVQALSPDQLQQFIQWVFKWQGKNVRAAS